MSITRNKIKHGTAKKGMLIHVILICVFKLFVLTVLQPRFNKRTGSGKYFYPSTFLLISVEISEG